MSIYKLVSTQCKNTSPFLSLEFFPPKNTQDLSSFFATVEKLKAVNPLFASVTYGAGGSSQDTTLDIACRLVKEGIPPMVHVTCVGATKESLHAYFTKLDQAGISTILALRGDPPAGQENYNWQKGEFRHASDLAEFIKANFPHFGVAVAAYAFPHPESVSFKADREATAKKLQISDFAVTQLFFDNREYFALVRSMQNLGCHQPIVPGILPVQSFESLRRILVLSGGNIPAKMYLALEEAHAKGGAEAVKEVGFTFAVEQIKRLLEDGAPGVHLYTLNKAGMCLRIYEEIKYLL